jgi:hypothetical protein
LLIKFRLTLEWVLRWTPRHPASYVPNLKWSVNQPTSNGVSTMKNSLISIDLAKNVFQVCAMDDDQKIVFNKKVTDYPDTHVCTSLEWVSG